jgi:hypothetical protein
MKLAALFLWMLLSIQVPPAYAQSGGTNSDLHLERLDTGAGAELLTLVSIRTGSPEPLISFLRDTLGDDDPKNDRIRYIWVLTYARPSFTQRMKAGVPFFYRKSGNAPNTDKPPKPIVDYSATSRRALTGVLGKLFQREFLDSNGMWSRATTRSYRGNADEYRNTRISQSLEAMSSVDLESIFPGLSAKELDRIQGRLIVTQRLFGDLTSEPHLSIAKERHELRNSAMRAANWEMLRQKAEENGLYFQPLRLGSQDPSYVLLWVAREDLAIPHGAFDKQLLHIPSPWNDERIADIGYSETWHFDDKNRRVDSDSIGSRQVEVIPLALYSLNHPKAPLLMVDFRDRSKVRRVEVRRRAFEDTAGVLSLGFFSTWPYLGARNAWTALRGRWGAPINRQARLRAYSNLRYELSVDNSLDPQLRALVAESVEHLSVNPFERSLAEESNLAAEQYTALKVWALSPNGLAPKLDRDRRAEMTGLTHGKALRGLFTVAHVASLGLYRHHEEPTPDRWAQLDRQRRINYHVAQLREVLESSPKPEVVASVRDIGESVELLSELSKQDPSSGKRVAKLVSRLFRQTANDGLRHQCLDSLKRMQHEAADNELAKLMADPELAAWLRSAQQALRDDSATEIEVSLNGAGGR